MRKILPLKGYASLKVLNAVNALLLGLKMLPEHVKTDYPTFFERFTEMPDSEKETLLRKAVAFVEIAKDEVEAIISFATDRNGVPYSAVNLKNLGPDEIHEIIVAVCMEISRFKIDLVSEDEKKKSDSGRSTLERPMSDFPN